MENLQHAFGPVPSRRLGNSLGLSPIPPKTCNYSCIYCQLGRTDHMTTQRREYYPVSEIIAEFETYLKDEDKFDVVTIVGEGEPTLYAKLGELIKEVKRRTDKPVAVITNSALLSDPQVREELMHCDIVLPSLDACDEETFRRIDRPQGSLRFQEIQEGLIAFSHAYTGQLWLEIMLCGGVNDSPAAIDRFAELLPRIRYDRLYINTPVRPPAEPDVRVASPAAIQYAVEKLGGISIDMLSTGSFFSEIADDYEAILSIIARHPMNQFEVMSFLDSRCSPNKDKFLAKLRQDQRVEAVDYKGITTFRRK
ncbi:radical SAM protein [Zongyangia hominis]|uniref:Radical SAM protein n=1 Tax=Zongyangia hominis TaxID=2763677 RepID=A0A926EE35_9FIRM|nr:radical SAM protein [Zongyangia hominis]MBC8570504.1 radical SAM protein [Zongyangia hominis]